jgi:hypothetical protein
LNRSKNGEFVESELGLIPKGLSVGTIGEICKITIEKKLFLVVSTKMIYME